MSTILSSESEFTALVQRFFVERLIQQQNASAQTVNAYRDTFRLLLTYAERTIGKSPTTMSLEQFDCSLIIGFLDYLEAKRHNSTRSRNARLAAIRAFAHYVALQCPAALHLAQQILAIPSKRYEKPMLGFLSREEIQSLLNAPNSATWYGQRDRIMLAVLYNTGARVSELIRVRLSDIILDGAASVRLHGKGRKQRTVPLWKETALQIRGWVKYQPLQPDQPLIPSRHGKPMTRSNVAERISLAVETAASDHPQLRGRSISPHTIRHTTAMHLLQAGVDISVIALWLGHESPITTHGYVEADLSMKERALATIQPPEVSTSRYNPGDKLLKFLEEL